MPVEPPPFRKQLAVTFANAGSTLSAVGRLCREHSSNQMALPQFGIHTAVRVCADYFNNSSCSGTDNLQTSPDGINLVTDTFSRLDIGADVDEKMETVAEHHPVSGVVECKCGMPLCICEVPASAPPTDAYPLPMKNAFSSIAQSNPKPKNTDTVSRNKGSTSNTKISSVFNPCQVTNVAMSVPQMDYEVNGEGLSEAIKNGDTAAVKKLLSEGVDANFHDKKGMSLLHLAALFN